MIITTERYLEQLKEKNIKVIPLETYIKSDTKILHKCICGNEWNSMPQNVKKGFTCGCKRKITTKKYLEQLKEKNIKVIPLQNYKSDSTKILHLCTCGNTWDIIPQEVKKGTKCGCENKKSNKYYINELKEKNIKIIPLQDYNGADTKILHKCICGNEWNVKPSSVLNNNRCGCGRVGHSREIYKDKPTILYYVTINGIYKIGLTIIDKRYKNIESNILKKRFSKDIKYNNIKVKIIKTEIYEDGSVAFDNEQEILTKYNKYRYMYENIDMNWFVGYTELFSKDIFNL